MCVCMCHNYSSETKCPRHSLLCCSAFTCALSSTLKTLSLFSTSPAARTVQMMQRLLIKYPQNNHDRNDRCPSDFL